MEAAVVKLEEEANKKSNFTAMASVPIPRGTGAGLHQAAAAGKSGAVRDLFEDSMSQLDLEFDIESSFAELDPEWKERKGYSTSSIAPRSFAPTFRSPRQVVPVARIIKSEEDGDSSSVSSVNSEDLSSVSSVDSADESSLVSSVNSDDISSVSSVDSEQSSTSSFNNVDGHSRVHSIDIDFDTEIEHTLYELEKMASEL
jgi:hypothetical protein